MSGTAIDSSQHTHSIKSRFADSTLSTTARSDSLATIMLGGTLYYTCETVYGPEFPENPEQRVETNIVVSEKSFEFFVQTIKNPPAPNPNLERLLRTDSE